MLDNRIYTFLELCNVMNYHKTAENLSMTQPAVSQHIRYLENLYDCKLFEYSSKQLKKTEKCIELEKYARSIISLNLAARDKLSTDNKIEINIGATKTIGDYILDDMLSTLLNSDKYSVNITIDNTKNLLEMLDHFTLDILMLEGFVDKEKYLHKTFYGSEIVGICNRKHKFANKTVKVADVFAEKTILRESGSGTRAVFEDFLKTHGYPITAFKDANIVSSNKLIEKAVEENLSISYVYKLIPDKNKNITSFKIENSNIYHEFNYVFLNEEKSKELISLLSPSI